MIASASALLAALTLWAGLSRAEDPGTRFDQTFTTSGETPLDIPAGVTSVDVVATGGRGASVSNVGSLATAKGGVGAVVSGRLSNLTPGEVLYLEVGGNGSPPDGGLRNSAPGGFNGGGAADAGPFGMDNFWNVGGGGGGASDVRTAPRGDGLDPDTRLVVAGGGGGAGHPINSSSAAGGNGGAGFNGSGAAGATGSRGASSGGGGGHGASSSAGGVAGTEGTGTAGTNGSLGQGGHGGSGPNNNPGGGGGGGGGGLFGGGGGRGGAALTSSSTGGGGGGGGSSKIPSGGSIAVAPGGSNGSIEIRYSIPGTDIDSGPSGSTTETTVTFDFSSNDSEATFECRLDSTDAADFAPCSSPYITPALALGTHTFDVFATNSMGNFDPTPASRTFTVEPAAVPVPPPPAATPPPATHQKAKCKKKKHKKHKRAAAAKKHKKKCKKGKKKKR